MNNPSGELSFPTKTRKVSSVHKETASHLHLGAYHMSMVRGINYIHMLQITVLPLTCSKVNKKNERERERKERQRVVGYAIRIKLTESFSFLVICVLFATF